MSLNRFLLLLFLYFFLEPSFIQSSQNSTCNSNDLNGLQGFMKGLNPLNLSWNLIDSSNCCSWSGVSCTPEIGLPGSNLLDRRVKILELGNKNLRGVVSKELAMLDQLEVLNLSSNFFIGRLPLELFQLQHLKVLDLSGNRFSGAFPKISNLPSIEAFDISSNVLSGNHPIFPKDKSLNLTYVYISRNLFTGPINTTSLCSSLPQVQVLDLSFNQFSGDISNGFGLCKSMTKLFLHSNRLSGNLPGDVFELTSLMQLDLHENHLSGQLDNRLEKLSHLFHLDLSNNGFYGSIPEVFSTLKNLIQFSARSNNFSGNLPRSLGSATMLGHLDLSNNSIEGRIEIKCSNLLYLNFLDLGFNQLIGDIPENLTSCYGLETLNLERNKLEGVIPDSLNNLTRLSYLSLSNNNFQDISRTLDVLQWCVSITSVILAGNFKGEEMPTRPIQGFNRLEVLSMPDCSLHGNIPSWLSNCPNLKVLDLSRNQLTGNIPSTLGKLLFMSFLNLSHNQFDGQIPTSIKIHSQTGEDDSFDEVMKVVVIRAPSILPGQRTEDLSFNQFTSIPPTIDLSNNQLSGPIPAKFGELRDLVVLDLSWNHLSDAIPDSLSNLSNLETLDLSNNNLTGNIPTSFAMLSFLARFNVSNNHLEGEIPKNGQFTTFPNSSFVGNLGLCGEPYYRPCNIEFDPDHSSEEEDRLRFEGTGFGVGAAMGFVTTVIVCALSGYLPPKEEMIIRMKLTAFCSYLGSCLRKSGSNGRETSASTNNDTNFEMVRF